MENSFNLATQSGKPGHKTTTMHVDDLSEILTRKGYVEFDLGPLGVPIQEALQHELRRAASNGIHAFTLATTVFSPDRHPSPVHAPVIQCQFRGEYSIAEGFTINTLYFSHGTAGNARRECKARKISFRNNEQIPESNGLFALAFQRKRGLKHP